MWRATRRKSEANGGREEPEQGDDDRHRVGAAQSRPPSSAAASAGRRRRGRWAPALNLRAHMGSHHFNVATLSLLPPDLIQKRFCAHITRVQVHIIEKVLNAFLHLVRLAIEHEFLVHVLEMKRDLLPGE